MAGALCVISTTTGQPLEARLNALHRAVHRIIELEGPGLLVVEDLYTEYKFPRTAILMGHARGVIYLAARQLGVSVLALVAGEVDRRHAASLGLYETTDATTSWPDLERMFGSSRQPTQVQTLPVTRGRVIAVWGPSGAPGRTTGG